MKFADSVPFIIGLCCGFIAGMIALASSVHISTEEIIQNACGSCSERSKACGEYTCTKDGWK